jgi:hemerythrin superfamily protein
MFGLTSDSPDSAVEVLKKDHDEVEKLFDQFEDAKDESNTELKVQIVAAVCKALTTHARVEEEIFYPAMRREVDAEDLVDEAAVEHQTLKTLVSELEAASPDDDLYDAKVKVLSEYVKHHVKEEEGELFPLARKSDLDLEALGRELVARKQELARAPDAPAPGRRRAARNGTHKAPARSRTATKSTSRKTAAHGGRQ